MEYQESKMSSDLTVHTDNFFNEERSFRRNFFPTKFEKARDKNSLKSLNHILSAEDVIIQRRADLMITKNEAFVRNEERELSNQEATKIMEDLKESARNYSMAIKAIDDDDSLLDEVKESLKADIKKKFESHKSHHSFNITK